MSLGFVLAILFSGFITGGLARFAIPGPDPMPIWLTLAIGLTGSIVGAVVGNAISHDNGYLVSFLSFGIAIALVAAYRRFVQKRPIFGPGALAFPKRGLGVEGQRDKLRKLGIDPDALRPDSKLIAAHTPRGDAARAPPRGAARRRRARREARSAAHPDEGELNTMFIIGLIIAGLVIGALGRLVHPGADPMPIWLTMAIGIAASLIVGILIGHGVFSFILAVVVAAVLVGVVGNMRRTA